MPGATSLARLPIRSNVVAPGLFRSDKYSRPKLVMNQMAVTGRPSASDLRPLLSTRQQIALLLLLERYAQVLVGGARGHAATRRPVKKAYLNQVRLDDLFD